MKFVGRLEYRELSSNDAIEWDESVQSTVGARMVANLRRHRAFVWRIRVGHVRVPRMA